MSEVLVLGTYSEGGVVLVTPDKKVGEIRRIYEYAQDYMIRSGNPTQWGHFYPSADLIRSDIQKRSAR